MLQLAANYRRMFPIFICNVELKNIDETGSKIKFAKWPGIVAILVATSILSTILFHLSVVMKMSSFTDGAVLYSSLGSHYFTFTFPVIYSMLKYREIHVFWCKIYEIVDFVFTDLGYEISLRRFWKCFFMDSALIVSTNCLYGVCRLWWKVNELPNGLKIGIVILIYTVMYALIHALFVVNLNHFFIRLLAKYINVDYRNRASNLVFDYNDRSLLHQLHLYKRFHYKLWELAKAVNSFLGISVLILNYHAFIDVAFAAYLIFYNISIGQPAIVSISIAKP